MDPRVERTRHAVLEATVELLREGGFAALSIDGVSQRSGVARTTIYRHWPGLPELILDVCSSLKPDVPTEPSADAREDLRAMYRSLARSLTGSRWGAVLPALLDASARDPDVRALQKGFVAERRARSAAIVQRLIDSGGLPADTDAQRVADRLASQLFYRHLLSHETIDDDFVDSLIDEALGPDVERRGPRASRNR